jgi:hypothetical protein
MDIQKVWGFVEEHYPDYSRSQEIADSSDLQKILDQEIDGSAEEVYTEIYNGNYYDSHKEFLESEDGKRFKLDYFKLHFEILGRSIEEHSHITTKTYKNKT